MAHLRLAVALLLAGCCCPVGSSNDAPAPVVQSDAPVPPPTATAYDAAYVDRHLARMREAAGCDGTRHPDLGVFCDGIAGWASGTAAPFPVGGVARLGVTTWVPTEGDVVGAWFAQRRFSVLAVSSAGGMHGDLVSPSPRSPMDQGPTTALGAVLGHLRGTQPAPIPIPMGVYDFVVGRTSAPPHVMATTANGWQLQGGSFADVRRVGAQWVAVEVPRQDPAGLYLSVFVDTPYDQQGF